MRVAMRLPRGLLKGAASQVAKEVGVGKNYTPQYLLTKVPSHLATGKQFVQLLLSHMKSPAANSVGANSDENTEPSHATRENIAALFASLTLSSDGLTLESTGPGKPLARVTTPDRR